jgi:hypothetical protein
LSMSSGIWSQRMPSQGRRIRDHHADRRRVEAVAWIVDLRTVVNHENHIHLRGDIDVVARRRITVDDGEIAGMRAAIEQGLQCARTQNLIRPLEKALGTVVTRNDVFDEL